MKIITLLPLALSATKSAHALPGRFSNPQSALPSGTWGVAHGLKSVWDAARISLGWPEPPDVWNIFEGALDDNYDTPDKTVLEWLSEQDDLKKITKLVKSDDQISELLDKTSDGLTFLAPNDEALTPPHKGEVLHNADVFSYLLAHIDDDDDDDEDKERRKKILNIILQYHILPFSAKSQDLGLNSTVPTHLKAKDGSFDGQHRRVKIEKTLIPPTLKFNKYASVIKADNEATNGIVHVIDHPLGPPPSVLDVAHLAPEHLSIFTSAIQKVDLQEAIDWQYVKGSAGKEKGPKFEGAPSVTVFAPTNEAFAALPERLVFYLFSPWGKTALAKLLSFHVIPEHVVYSEWVHDARKEKNDDVGILGTEFEFDHTFPTALKNLSLPVHIKKSTPAIPLPGVAYWEFSVLGVNIPPKDLDIPARNGVLHLVPTVLDPRKVKQEPHHHKDSVLARFHCGKEELTWDDWEDWLPVWAMEE